MAKHKVTEAADITLEARRAWLYLGGQHVSCGSTARIAFAMLQNINPECTKKLDSAALGSIKLSLLQHVRQQKPSAIYPGVLSEIGDQQEVLEMAALHERLERTSSAAIHQVRDSTTAGLGCLEDSREMVRAILAEVEAGQSTKTLQEAVITSQSAPWDGWFVYPHSFNAGMRFRRAKFCDKMVKVLAQCEHSDLLQMAVIDTRATQALLCLRNYAAMCAVIARYTCSKKDSQLVKEVDGAINDIRIIQKFCAKRLAVEPLHQIVDSLCLWEQGGMRLLSKWSSHIVLLVCAMSREDRHLFNEMSCRSRKMQQLAAQGLWTQLPRSKATVLLLLDGDSVDDAASAGQVGVGGRSKRRRVAKLRA